MGFIGIVCVVIGVLVFIYICALMKSGSLPNDDEEKWVKEYLKKVDEKRLNNDSKRSD